MKKRYIIFTVIAVVAVLMMAVFGNRDLRNRMRLSRQYREIIKIYSTEWTQRKAAIERYSEKYRYHLDFSWKELAPWREDESLLYAEEDISCDGVPELIIASKTTGDNIYIDAVYTKDNYWNANLMIVDGEPLSREGRSVRILQDKVEIAAHLGWVTYVSYEPGKRTVVRYRPDMDYKNVTEQIRIQEDGEEQVVSTRNISERAYRSIIAEEYEKPEREFQWSEIDYPWIAKEDEEAAAVINLPNINSAGSVRVSESTEDGADDRAEPEKEVSDAGWNTQEQENVYEDFSNGKDYHSGGKIDLVGKQL